MSFHVGSQQRDPEAWAHPIAAAARVFKRCARDGLRPWLLDLGGGFPALYEGAAAPRTAYGEAIERHLRRAFGDAPPATLVEPGRGIVGDAGTLVTSSSAWSTAAACAGSSSTPASSPAWSRHSTRPSATG